MTREQNEEPETNPTSEGPLPGICTALVLQSPVSTWIADRDGTCIFENEAARRLFGIERDEEVVGKYNIFKDDVLIAGGYVPQIRKVFEEGGSTEIIVDYDFSQVTHVEPSQPTHKILHAFLFAIKDREGRVRNVIVQHEDWTERTSTEKALKKSEERYRDLAEGMADWIWEIDLEGRCTYSSPAIKNILGYTPEEVIGRPILDFFLPEYREEAVGQIRRASAEGRGIVGSLTGEVHKDGSIRYLETNAKPVFDESGNPVGFRGMNRDVTTRVEAERALEAEKERFRALIDNASDIITVMNGDGIITYVSPSVERVLGYDPEDLIGRNAFHQVHPDDVAKQAEDMSSLLRQEGAAISTEFRLRHRDGSWRTFEAVAQNLLGNPAIRGIVINQRDITERKRAEEALRESEERYRSFVQNFRGIAYESGIDWVPIFFHGAVMAITGYTEDDFILGKPSWDQVICPEDLAAVIEAGEPLTREPGRQTEREYRILRKDGEIRWVHEMIQSVGDEPGRVQSLRGVLYDITERKRGEQALQSATEELTAIFDSSPVAISSIDLDGKVVTWNPAAADMFGWTQQEVVGTRLPVIPEDRWHLFEATMERMLQGEAIVGMEVICQKKDGSTIAIGCSVAPLHDAAGNVNGFVGMMADITMRKRAEEALRESNEQLGTIIATSPLAIITLDLDGKVTSWNPAAENMFGWTAQEVIGKPMPILPDDQLSVFREFIQRLLRGEVLSGEEVPHIRKDGTRVEISVSVAGLHDSTGATVGFMGMTADITERKRAEEALRESEETNRALLSAMPDLMFRISKDGVFLTTNAEVDRRFFVPPDRFLGKSVGEVLPGPMAELVMDYVGRTLRTGEPQTFEYDLPMNSELYRYEARMVAMGDSIIAVVRDITERKRAEEAAQRKQQEVITLLNTVPGYVFWKDAKSVYITANEVFAKAVGVPVSEIPGKTDYDLFPKDLAEKYGADDRRLVEAGTPLEIGEEETIEGSRRLTVETRKVPLKDDRGSVIGLIGIALDVTARTEAEARFRELEEHRREFYRRTILAATEGKLVITEADEIKKIAGKPIAKWEIKGGEDLSFIRQAIGDAARSVGMDEDRACDFILAVGEVTTNAYKHAGGGETSLHRVNDSLMVVVSDRGKGIEALSLPEVALVRGYSTVGSLGMGYKAVLSIADKAFLATGPTGTTAAIEMRIHPAESPVVAASLPDTWKTI